MPRWLLGAALTGIVLAACRVEPHFAAPQIEATRGEFTLAVLPDTQGYTQAYPEIFTAQTEWLVENSEALALKMVVHVGDLVQSSWATEDWERGRASMAVLDGHIPYVISPGNHDLGADLDCRNARCRTTRLSEFFPAALFEAMPTYRGRFPEGDRIDSTYHTFEAGGERWLVLALEFGPRDAVLDWANGVLKLHSDHRAIIVTHAYLSYDNRRLDWARYPDQEWNPHAYEIGNDAGGVNDGQEIYGKIVAPNPNVFAVVCGHVLDDGVGYSNADGVHEMLANYQMNNRGGEGYLRLLKFDPGARRVQVATYSPWLSRFSDSPDDQFEFSY